MSMLSKYTVNWVDVASLKLNVRPAKSVDAVKPMYCGVAVWVTTICFRWPSARCSHIRLPLNYRKLG